MVTITVPATRSTVAEVVDRAGHLPAPVYAAVVLGAAAWYGLTWWRCLPRRWLAAVVVLAATSAGAGLAVATWLF